MGGLHALLCIVVVKMLVDVAWNEILSTRAPPVYGGCWDEPMAGGRNDGDSGNDIRHDQSMHAGTMKLVSKNLAITLGKPW